MNQLTIQKCPWREWTPCKYQVREVREGFLEEVTRVLGAKR